MSDTAPSMEDCNRMWEAIDFPRLTDQDYPNVMAYVRALEDIYANGSVEFSTFDMPARTRRLIGTARAARFMRWVFFKSFGRCQASGRPSPSNSNRRSMRRPPMYLPAPTPRRWVSPWPQL